MKILNLIIKQVYFDEILAGTKKEEYREVKPTTFKKYLRVSCCGEEFDSFDAIPDKEPYKSALEKYDFELIPIEFDALRLYVGYNKDRDSMLIKVKDNILEHYVDANEFPIPQTYTTRSGKRISYFMSQMVYELGEILETDIHHKKSKTSDKYMAKVKEELKKYDLTVEDLTKEEMAEMLEEAKEIIENPDSKYMIFDGYFENPVPFANIQMRKEIKKTGKAENSTVSHSHNKDYNALFLEAIAEFGLKRTDFTDEEYNEAIEELRGEDEGMLYEDGILGSMFLSKRQLDKELAKNTSIDKDESTQKK